MIKVNDCNSETVITEFLNFLNIDLQSQEKGLPVIRIYTILFFFNFSQ